MMLCKRILLGLTVCLLACSLSANGLNLNGVGSKAIAMGGAFIGLADDYSAVFWNPAGLTQIKKPTLFLFQTDLIPTGTYKFATYGIDAQTVSKVYPSGAIGYLKPIGEKMVIGIAAYVPSGTGAKWDGNELKILAKGGVYEWESFMAIATICPVFAYQVSDKISLGATLNLNYGMMNLKRAGVGQYTEKIHGLALGATLSALVKPSDKLQFGLTFRTPSKVNFKGDATMDKANLLGMQTTSDATRETTWPMWIGLGVAIKPFAKLTVTLDGQYTDWKQQDTIGITYTDAAWQAIRSNATYGPAFENDFVLNWKAKWQLRVGLEYAISDKWAVRGGYYYDPSPAPVTTLNILLPEITYSAPTFGFGYSSGRLTIDACLEYLSGKDAVSPLGSKMPGTHGMKLIVPNIAIAYHLK